MPSDVRGSQERSLDRLPVLEASLLWLALAVLFALHEFASSAADGDAVPLGVAAYWSASEWVTWAAVTPLVLWVVRRSPLGDRATLMRFASYALFGVAVAALQIVLQAGLDAVAVRVAGDAAVSVRAWLSGGTGLGTARLAYLLPRKLGFSYVVFWVLVAAAHAAMYYRLYRARELEAAKAEADLAAARLQSLRQRLQPHFLFNTLNGIAELVREDPRRAETLIAELGHLLRAAVAADDRETITLAEEIALSRSYLDLQRSRFGDRLAVNWSLDDSLDRMPVPPQFLQPVLENAVRFAMAREIAPAEVAITAQRSGRRATILVEDSGPGPTGSVPVLGTGLEATRARLASVFGTEFAMVLTRGPSGGGLMRFDLPCLS